MPYQLIILPKSWFLTDVTPNKFEVLLQILNKGYAKPMAQYGVIESLRIKANHDFLGNLQIDLSPSAALEKNFAFMLLVGSKSDYKRLHAHAGYTRRFNPEIYPLSLLGDSDIPPELAGEFGPIVADNIEHVTLAPSDPVGADVADRVLATIGLKTYKNDGYFTSSDLFPRTHHYELTGLTSFMRGAGSGIINYVTREFLASQKTSLLKPENDLKVVLHAVVIKEHDLVPFYENACGFKLSAHPSILIKRNGSQSIMEDGIRASRDFNLVFMRKNVLNAE